ncbi:MAG: hypothetical protein AAF696_22820, partial [Bacteroidota bacterium]
FAGQLFCQEKTDPIEPKKDPKVFPYTSDHGLKLKIKPQEKSDIREMGEFVSARRSLTDKKLAQNQSQVKKSYVYSIQASDTQEEAYAFVPKAFKRSEKASIKLADQEAVLKYNQQMELEEQYRYAKKKSINLINLQFNSRLYGTDLDRQSSYTFSPTIQINPLGLIDPALQGLFSAGLSLNMPGELVFLSDQDEKNTLGMHLRFCLPIRGISLGVQRDYVDYKLLPFQYPTDYLLLGIGRDGYSSPMSLKLFYRISEWRLDELFDNISNSARYSIMLSINVFNLGNGMKNYKNQLRIVSGRKRVKARRYEKTAARFNL